MNKTVLNKDVRIENDMAIIREETETKLDRQQLEMKLRDVQMRKLSLQDQNKRLITEYNQLAQEENEINNLISQLATNEGVTEI